MRARVVLVWGVLALAIPAGCDRGPQEPALDVSDPVAANNRGVGLMGMYKYQEAADLFRALSDKQPDNADVKVNLAIAVLNRQQEGDEAKALEILGEALELDPDHLRARYCAGLLLYRSADAGALEHLRFVAEADPQDPYAAYYYGSALEQADRSDEALVLFRRAMDLDPYLKSACYRVSRLLLRAGHQEEGLALQERFQKLGDNPRARTVGDVYMEMGPKAEAVAFDAPQPHFQPPPAGKVFAETLEPLYEVGGESWPGFQGRLASISACDIDGDGDVDVFIPDHVRGPNRLNNAVLLNRGDGTFALAADHPLASIPQVMASLWGDYDNDGLTDVYFCRKAPNMLWRQVEPGVWRDVTEATGTANERFTTVDGAFFDADHDGDLDIFCVNRDGPNELLINNRDGTFSPMAAEMGIDGGGSASWQVLITDLDDDRDADIIVLNEKAPHEAYVNDRLWAYRPAEGLDLFLGADILTAVAGDADADGLVELYTALRNEYIARWDPDAGGVWRPASVNAGPIEVYGHRHNRLALVDFDGDGALDLLTNDRNTLRVHSLADGALLQRSPRLVEYVVACVPVVLDPAAGPSVVALPGMYEPVIWRPGPGRYGFAALRFSGMEDPGLSMRSNASGIGTRFAVRVDSRWTMPDTFRSDSGPGQSLQPVPVGLGGAPKIDFVAMDWSDGVLQSEIDLAAGELHVISEHDRRPTSCPVLFAFNGETFEFVTDLLGVGGIGYMIAPGEYYTPRPWENLVVPEGALRPTDGRYALKLGEPMEEACYLDSVGLVVYDVPPGWRMTLDERMGILGPQPTGEPRYYRHEILPARAVNDRGQDVTELVAAADHRAAPVGELDRRFLGRLEAPNVVTLTFDEPLTGRDGQPMLVADGWIEYPYSQTMFGAWQAGAGYSAPTVEARGADGEWRVVLEQFGYPAGMPRQMSVPLDELPAGALELRISTNQEIYWDRLAVAFAETPPKQDGVSSRSRRHR